MKRSMVAAGVVALVLSLAVPAGANHSWNGYHWKRSSNPKTVKLGDNVDSRWNSSLSGAASDWTQSSVLDTPVVAGRSRPLSCGATRGRVEVCNASYGPTGWLGIARVWLSGNHITKATVKVNDFYSALDDPDARQHVMCQEIGHTLGLEHQHSGDVGGGVTCMNDTDGLNDPSYAHPNSHDYSQLESIYSHLDGSGAKASSSESVIVRTTGPTTRIVTFITWA